MPLWLKHLIISQGHPISSEMKYPVVGLTVQIYYFARIIRPK